MENREEYIRKNASRFTKSEWWKISKSEHISDLPSTLLIEYSKFLYWNSVSLNENLTEELISDLKNFVNWNFISQREDLTEEFINKFRHKLNFEFINKRRFYLDNKNWNKFNFNQ